MKKWVFLIVFFELILLIGNGSCFADDKVYQFRLPKYVEPIHGTWINEEYGATILYDQKWIFYNWGYFEEFHKISDKHFADRGMYILVEKWQDAYGNVWYKELGLEPAGGHYYYLKKVSEDGTTLESVLDYSAFPKESDLNPNNSWYRIYHRQ